MNIWAGDVDLQNLDLVRFVEPGAVFHVLLQGETADVGDDRAVKEPGNVGNLLMEDCVHAGILEANGVQHAGGGFGNAGLGVARAGLGGGALPGEGAQNVQVIELRKLPPVAEGSRGGNDGVFQCHPSQSDGQVYHRMSSFWNMGPSLHTRQRPFFV